MIGVRVQLALAATLFVTAAASAVTFRENGPFTIDFGCQLEIPAGFGEGEFTLELRIKPDASYPVGPVTPQDSAAQLKNWYDGDPEPYSRDDWWFLGNFLIDGHNNEDFRSGTFSVQFYGGGRVRWLFGDGAFAGPGSHWAVQAYPAASTPSLLDGQWHVIAMVRRWAAGPEGAELELWVDGKKIAAQRSGVRANMRKYWDGWPGFRAKESGWRWGAEKQSVNAVFDQYEDFKGEVSDALFWSIARAPEDLAKSGADAGRGARGLAGLYKFPESFGGKVCNEVSGGECVELDVADRAWHWKSNRRTNADWAVTLTYLWAGAMAGLAALRGKGRAPGARVWWAMSTGMAGLAAFTWLDLSLLLDQRFKLVARAGGWYEVRMIFQGIALAIVIGAAAILARRILRIGARLDFGTRAALVASLGLAVIAIVRSASLHATDVILDSGPPVLPIGQAMELAGACAVAVSALIDQRRLDRTSKAGA